MTISKYIFFSLFAIIFGILEAYIYAHGFISGNYVFLMFSWYHIICWLLFGLVIGHVFYKDYKIYRYLLSIGIKECDNLVFKIVLSIIKYAILMAFLEDITYYIIMGGLTAESWVSRLMGSFEIGSVVIPCVYLLMFLVPIIQIIQNKLRS